MIKISFIGAGSTIFAKNILGDVMLTPSLQNAELALYDIDEDRLAESHKMLGNINKNVNKNRSKIVSYTDRKEALKDAHFVINAIQVGGYKPSTVIDFEIAKKYGLEQTIGDTLGIGGIFRALRTIPVMLSIAEDMEEVCPNALLLNYTNPMSILTQTMLTQTNIKTVGLCHSVQGVVEELYETIGWDYENDKDLLRYKVAGINHMAWLLEIEKNGKNIYPLIKKEAQKLDTPHTDAVRIELMSRFGYYVTESSEHNAEYHPYFIKEKYPELIDKYMIPLDEYLRRCEIQIKDWETQRDDYVNNGSLTHERSVEYGSYIMDSIVTGKSTEIAGNVLNNGLISNLPDDAVVEVPCLVNKNGVQPTRIGELPIQLAALNRTHINVHQLVVEAAITKSRNKIYQAAYLDPHTSSELSLNDIESMVDELIEAHGDYLPEFS